MTDLRTAAQQALEALEEAHPKPYNESVISHVEAITSLRTAIAEAERQEPMVVSKECAERGCMAHDDRVDGPGVVIERQWVGLTDEEVNVFVWNMPYEPGQAEIRAIEAKLKEKNT